MNDERTEQNRAEEPLSADALREGAARFGVALDDGMLESFREFYRAIREGNARVNLISDTGWETLVERHFLESLSAVDALPNGLLNDLADGAAFADVGSGAGLPGIPLAIAFPNARGVLLDSRARKVEFLQSAIGRLGLDNLRAVHGRAEDLGRRADMRERFDFVFARAVAKAPTLLELALPLCRVGGRAIFHKTESADAELRSAERAAAEMGGSAITRAVPYSPDPNSRRILAIVDKIKPTPRRYPRQPGVPGRRPVLPQAGGGDS